MLYVIYLMIFVIISLIVARNQKMQKVTLLLGRYLSKGNELAGKRGFQDAISPRSQNWSNNFLFLALILFVGGLFVFPWYEPILALFGAMIIAVVSMTIDRYRTPHLLMPFIGKIIGDLARRSADYAKKGDHERSEAAKEMAEMINTSVEELTALFGPYPTIEQLESLLNH